MKMAAEVVGEEVICLEIDHLGWSQSLSMEVDRVYHDLFLWGWPVSHRAMVVC